MEVYIDCNDKTQRKEMFDYVHSKISTAEKHGRCSSVIRLGWMKKIEAVMERQEEIIEDQEERIAIMSEGDTEAMLNKACETIANFDLDFVCDDNTLDDGWCNEHCKATGQKPECFRHWLLKQTTEPPKEGDVDG